MGSDYLLTSGFGILIIIGGCFAFAKTGSTDSLLMAGIAGALLLYSGYSISKPRTKLFGYRIAIGVTALLMFVMGYRFYLSGKFMPGGLVALLSTLMTIINVIQLNKL